MKIQSILKALLMLFVVWLYAITLSYISILICDVGTFFFWIGLILNFGVTLWFIETIIKINKI